MAILYLQEKLEGEYRDVYERVDIYSMNTELDENTTDELLMNLLDSLLSAQENGQPVEKIVGSDIEHFCREYFDVYDRRDRLGNYVTRAYKFAWFVFVIEMIEMVINLSEGIPLLKVESDITPYLLSLLAGGIVSVISGLLLYPVIIKKKKVNSTAYSFIMLLLLMAMIVAGAIWCESKSIVLPLLPILVICGIYIVIYILVRACLRYRETGSVRRQKDSFRKYKKQVEEEAKNEKLMAIYAHAQADRYDRLNRKLIRKGKEPLKPEGFMEKLQEEQKKQYQLGWLIDALLAAFMLGMILFIAQDSTLVDTIIFSAIMVVIYIVYLKWLKNMFGGNVDKLLLEECDRQGVTVVEYDSKKNIYSEEEKNTDEFKKI